MSHPLTRAMRDAVEETAFRLCRTTSLERYRQTREELYELATTVVKEATKVPPLPALLPSERTNDGFH